VDLYPMPLVIIAGHPQGLTDIPIDLHAKGAAVMELGSLEALLEVLFQGWITGFPEPVPRLDAF
jgi:hypothetical protein